MILTWITLGILGLMASGCVRLSDAQAQQLAQAQANIVATAAVAKKEGVSPQLQDLITADLCRINAALANAEMPPPFVAPSVLITDPVACSTEASNATEAEKNPPPGVFTLTSIIVASLSVIALIGRFAPALSAVLPWFGPLWKACEIPVKLAAEVGWAVVATKTQKDADAKKAT